MDITEEMSLDGSAPQKTSSWTFVSKKETPLLKASSVEISVTLRVFEDNGNLRNFLF
jgi:hypothetical protein